MPHLEDFSDVHQAVGDQSDTDADCVRFEIYALDTTAAPTCAELLAACWEASGTYLWHTQGIGLAESPPVAGCPCYAGQMCYSGDPDDEWNLTAILLQVSRRYGSSIAVRMQDADGQFILIEAADILPPWMDPSGMDNRVFFKAGLLSVIPVAPTTPGQIYVMSQVPGAVVQDAGDDCPPVPLEAAVALMRAASERDFYSPDLHSVLAGRIEGLPESAAERQQHCVRMSLPTPVACALQRCPQLAAEAVRLLSSNDPAALRAMRSMPDFSPTSCGASACMVRYTRALHALLQHSPYVPPPALLESLATTPDAPPEGSAESTASAKLAAGFQAAYSLARLAGENAEPEPEEQPTPPHPHAPPPSGEAVPAAGGGGGGGGGDGAPRRGNPAADAFEAEVRRTKEERQRALLRRQGGGGGGGVSSPWDLYVARLTRMGYFGGEVEGSKLWQEKLQAARQFFGAEEGVCERKPAAGRQEEAGAAGAGAEGDEAAPTPSGGPSWLPQSYHAMARKPVYDYPGEKAAEAAPLQGVECFGSDGQPRRFDVVVRRAIASWAEGVRQGCGRVPLEFPRRVEFPVRPSDSEEWMSVEPEAFDRFLGARFDPDLAESLAASGRRAAEGKGEADEYRRAQQDLADALAKLPQFLDAESSHQGAEACGAEGVVAAAAAAAPQPQEDPAPVEAKKEVDVAEVGGDDGRAPKGAPKAAGGDFLPRDSQGDDKDEFVPLLTTEWRFDEATFQQQRAEMLGVEDLCESDSDSDDLLDSSPCDIRLRGAGLEGEGALDMAAADYMSTLDSELREHAALDRLAGGGEKEEEAVAFNSFAASLKSQGGKAGPVSTMIGSLA